MAGVTGLSAQPARPGGTGSTATIEQLLAEVRELRTELNQAASRSIHTQLLVARLQLQEGRIDSIARQLGDTRRQMANADQTLSAMAGPLKAFGSADRPMSDEDQEAQKVFLPLQTMLAAQQTRAEELRVQETSLAALLASEQSRWVELNDRLEEVQKMLPAPKPR
jgi:chromosome segregation ATPase